MEIDHVTIIKKIYIFIFCFWQEKVFKEQNEERTIKFLENSSRRKEQTN